MNEAHLTEIEAQRLNHWRIGHRSVAKSVLNEDCPVCTEEGWDIQTKLRISGQHERASSTLLEVVLRWVWRTTINWRYVLSGRNRGLHFCLPFWSN
jgi:hypothetical protein